MGHRRIAYIMDSSNDSTAEGRTRIAGYQTAMATAHKTAGNGDMHKYESGVNGAVSTNFSGQSVFAFVDGHAKSQIPSVTNPGPVN
ncbi:MAG: hypothetical protein P4L46_09705 [Fimbriimonas sp.]|nr:hypothetical protein [Fimbriimonas sp.]